MLLAVDLFAILAACNGKDMSIIRQADRAPPTCVRRRVCQHLRIVRHPVNFVGTCLVVLEPQFGSLDSVSIPGNNII